MGTFYISGVHKNYNLSLVKLKLVVLRVTFSFENCNKFLMVNRIKDFLHHFLRIDLTLIFGHGGKEPELSIFYQSLLGHNY